MAGSNRTEAATPTGRGRRPSAARARIVDVASRLFYAEGIRAVGVDRVVTEAGVTRVTCYRHFPSKDHLVTAYLAARLDRDRERFADLRGAAHDDPMATLMAVGDAALAEVTAPGFRGCPYVNAAAEHADPAHPARAVGADHRGWLLGEIESLLAAAGHARPAAVAEQLVMLRAGLMAVSAVADLATTGRSFLDAWRALVDDRG